MLLLGLAKAAPCIGCERIEVAWQLSCDKPSGTTKFLNRYAASSLLVINEWLHAVHATGLAPAPAPRLRGSRRRDHGPHRAPHDLDRDRRHQHARTHRGQRGVTLAGERELKRWRSPAIPSGAERQYSVAPNRNNWWRSRGQILSSANQGRFRGHKSLTTSTSFTIRARTERDRAPGREHARHRGENHGLARGPRIARADRRPARRLLPRQAPRRADRLRSRILLIP